MKLRYYLRGLGIGIVVTALVMTMTGSKEGSLSDAEIKRRAAELGMVESTSLTLADLQNNANGAGNKEDAASKEQQVTESEGSGRQTDQVETSKQEESSSSQSVEAQESSTKPSGGEEVDKSVETGGSEAQADSAEAEVSDEQGNSSESETNEAVASSESQQNSVPEPEIDGNGAVTVTVQAGESSYTVSKQLEELGLIEDALRFDNYLCAIGYSRIIHTGTHKIVPGTSEEEIAKIITGKR